MNIVRTEAEMQAFGEKVKVYRKRLGLTQRDFLPLFSHTIIARYEAGKAMPRGKRLWDLAKILRVHPDDLVPPTPQTLSITRHRSYSRAVDAMNCGDWDAAFQAAQDFSRLAFRLGDANLIDQSHVLMKNIMPNIPEDEAVLGVLRNTKDLFTLRKMVSMAFASGNWRWALIINEAEWRLLHEGSVYNEEEYGRIIRNRGRLLYEVGDFADSAEWYSRAQALAKRRQTIMLHNATLLAGAEAYMHAGLPVPDFSGVALQVTDSRIVWRSYWHLLGYIAWRKRDWDQLAHILHQARETFVWTDGGRDDLLLSGLHAALDIHKGDEAGLGRLEQVLLLPNFDAAAGDGAHRDVLFDYLQLLLDIEHPAATVEWASAVHTAHSTGRDGWVHFYLQRPPALLNMASVPLAIRVAVQQVMDSPPEVTRDALIEEAQA